MQILYNINMAYIYPKRNYKLVTWRVKPPRKFKEETKMKVVYMSGKDGVLSDEQSTGLHVQGRHTRQEWQDLEDEMKKLNIIEF